MSRLVFLLEEDSMRVLLEGLLPRLFPGLPFLCVPHEGKQDLEKSIPRRMRGWREAGVRFVVVRDKDAGPCEELKRKVVGICEEGGQPNALVRIACQELEAWYLGEPAALAKAFERKELGDLGVKARFRDPDAVVEPSKALKALIPEFQKVKGARRMALTLTRRGNTSRSFRVLLQGIEKEAQALGAWPPGKGDA